MATTTRAPDHDVPNTEHKGSGGFPIGKALGYLTLVVFAIIYLYPFVIQIVTSFKTDADATGSPLSLLPNPFTLGAFERLFQENFGRGVPSSTAS